jgi:aspartate racemase
MAKHIGIVACSAEGAALCYRTICLEAAAYMGEHAHPEITLNNICMAVQMADLRSGGWEAVADLLLESAGKVEAAGADFAICPDNTVHLAFDYLLPRSPIPWLHIAEVVADEAADRGYERIGVMGTRYLMEGPVYKGAVARRGIEMATPCSEDRERIDRIIFKELVNAVFTDDSREYLNEVMRRLAEMGCDAAVLGCTEIPLIVRPEEAPLPTLDSTRLLARAALRHALEA